jgi:hypothetical protein
MTTQTSWRVGLWTLLLAVSALGGVASAQSGQGYGSRITVYADINFAGQSASFDGDTPNLASAGWNDNISSIRVPNGETWEICVDENFGNQCQAVTGSVADLRSTGWNDRISSIRRINNGGGRGRGWGRGNDSNLRSAGVAVYANTNYKGQSTVLHSDTPNLVTLNMNDKVSSIRIPNGETWEVCQDINYESECQVLSASVADLRRSGWGDRISSLRRVNDRGFNDRRTGTGGVFQGTAQQSQRSLVFFDRAGFRGASTPVSTGSSRMGVAAWQGSVQIRGGGAWELCDNSGNCTTIDQDVSDLSYLGLNDRITSARVVNNAQYRR